MDSAGRHFELLHNLHTGVVVYRADSSVVYCNKRAVELLGLTEDQLLGKATIDPIWRFVDALGQAIALTQYPAAVEVYCQ